MKCKEKFIKILAVLLLGFVAINLSLKGMDNAVTHSELQPIVPGAYEVFGISLTSEPLAYLFQILFILFIISPPLIVLMLFLIWRELKERNRLK